MRGLHTRRMGAVAAGATVGVVIIGETPYAEMMGDRTDLRLAAEDVTAIDNVKSAGIPVVVILISGRPLSIDAVLDKADAVVATWLPGTEGDGVADMLFGDFKPVGKLSFTCRAALRGLCTLGMRATRRYFLSGVD